MSRYLVTGGAGFIGSHITEALAAAGHEVRVLDDLSFGRRENLAACRRDIELIEGDIRDQSCLERAVGGVDGIFHQAALPSVPRSVKDPFASHDVNVTGTLKLLIAAREAGAKVVYAGSSSAYGDAEVMPKRESMPVAPLSPYAASKLAGEHYVQAFACVYGLEAVILRYFNVYGPRQRADSPYSGVIALFCRTALADGVCQVEGDGEQTRDFTYVGDVVRGNLLAMATHLPGPALLNLAGGNRSSLNQLLDILEELLGRSVARTHVDSRRGDVKHSQAAVELVREQLGFRAEISFEEGIRRTLEWYKASEPPGVADDPGLRGEKSTL